MTVRRQRDGTQGVVEEPPQPAPRRTWHDALPYAALAAVTAVIAGAFLFVRPTNEGQPGSPSSVASSAVAPSGTTDASSSGTPDPLAELPSAGELATTVRIRPSEVLTLGAFRAAWLVDEEAGLVVRLDPRAGAVTARYRVRPRGGDGPLPLAAADGILWVGRGGVPALVGLDPRNGDVLLEVDVGITPWSLAAGHGEVWAIDAERGLVVGIDASSGEQLHWVDVEGATDVALGDESVWVTSTVTNGLVEIDRGSGLVLRSVLVGPTPLRAVLDPGGTLIYVVGRDGLPLTTVDVSGTGNEGTGAVGALTIVGGVPWGLLPDGRIIGPFHPESLELTAAFELPATVDDGLVVAGGLVWTAGDGRAFGVRPSR